jgi:hypothetical protein
MRASILVALFYLLSSLVVNASTVSRDDERWHDLGNAKTYPMTAPNSYEWFYYDVHHENGGQLTVVFLGPNLFDVTLADLKSGSGTLGHVGVSAQAYVPNLGPVLCNDFVIDASKLTYQENRDGSQWDLTIQNSHVHMQEGGNGMRDYHIDLNVTCRLGIGTFGTITGQLDYTGVLPGWKHGDGNLYASTDGSFYNSWLVAQPRAKVTGQYIITLASQNNKPITIDVNGDEGYHDHNRGNVPLSTANDGWYWGRAVTPSGKVMVYSYLYGKSQAAFPGDVFVAQAPSAVLYVNDGTTMVDTDQVNLNVVGDKYELKDSTYGIDMMIPQQYNMTATNSPYSFQAKMPKSYTIGVPFYLRQNSVMDFTDANGNTESGFLFNEQMELKAYFKAIGLPVSNYP